MAVLLHAVPLAGVCRKERSSPVPRVRARPEEMRCAPHSRPPPQFPQISAAHFGPFFGSAQKTLARRAPLGPAQASPNTLNTHDTQITIRHS